MVYYECFRCGYNTKHRGNFQHHLNRKNICNPVEDDVEIEEIKKYYGFDNCSKMTPNHSKLLQNESKSLQISPNCSKNIDSIESKMNPNESKNSENESKMNPNESKNIHRCNYCNKCYSTSSNMRKHEKTCKKKKEIEINQNNEIIMMKKETENMKKEIEELKNFKIQTQNNTTNNNNSHNNITNNNTININNYGSENLKHLRSKDFAGLLNGIYGAVPKLIEKIHFDPKHPENQNIKFTNR